ncbi:MAG: alpha/beta hydrolase [Pseudomonadota bacterium]
MRRDLEFETSSGNFHYIDWGGDGPLAHICHANGFCAGTYEPLAERLATRLRVLGLDQRGHGRTTAAADPRRLKDWSLFARDLERFFEGLGRPVAAIGHSLGGVVSLMTAVRRPDLVRALVLVDPTILPPSWMWWWRLAKIFGLARRIPIAAKAARRREYWPDRETMLRAFRGRGIFRTWQDGFLEGYVNEGALENPDGSIRLACRPAWEAGCFASCIHDSWDYVRRLKVPTLLIFGTRSDTFLPPARKFFRKVLPEAVCVGLEDATHFAPMDQPDQTARTILEFLGRHGI